MKVSKGETYATTTIPVASANEQSTLLLAAAALAAACEKKLVFICYSSHEAANSSRSSVLTCRCGSFFLSLLLSPLPFFFPSAFHRNSQRFREVLEGARANASTQVNVSLPSLPSTIDIPTKKLWRQGQQQQRQQQQQQQIAQEEDEGTRSHANGLPATVAAAADAADPIAALSLYFQQTVPGVPAPPPGVPAPPSPPAPPPGLPHLPNLPNFPPPNIPSLPGNASITVIDPRKFGQLLKIFDALMHYHVSPGQLG